MADKIGIMGAGALGSYVGAFLSREGEDVTFIDMWPEHVEKMRTDGLHVTGSQGPFTVPPAVGGQPGVKAMHLTEAQGITEPFDFVFVSVKSYDTEWATHFIKRYVKDDGFFVSLQNCWNDVTVAAIVGEERTLGCIASHIEVALWEPGHVTRGGAVGRDHGHHVFRVGEYSERLSPRSEMVAGLLDCIDGAYPSNNLWGETVGQAVPERHGQWHIRRIRSRFPRNGRRPSMPDDTHSSVQGRGASGSGHGPERGGHQWPVRPDMGRRRQGRRVRGVGRLLGSPGRPGQLAGVHGSRRLQGPLLGD